MGNFLVVIIVVILALSTVIISALCVWLHLSLRKVAAAKNEVIELKKDMETATKAKGEFLVSMSQEIRTSMNALTNFVEILTQRSIQNCSVEIKEETEGIRDIIKKNSRDIINVFNDVIDYIKIDANLLEIESVPMSIKQVIHDICHVNKPNVAAKRLDLSIKYVGVVPPTILSDPLRIRQILSNFIDNAIKFTEKGTVTVLCETLDSASSVHAEQSSKTAGRHRGSFSASLKQIKISVIDTGIGISPDRIQELFKPFRVPDAESPSLLHHKRVAGLGLNIAMRLATLLDGTINVESTPGHGSVFSLLLNVYVPEDSSTSLEEHWGGTVSKNDHSKKYVGIGIREPKKESAAPEGKNLPLRNVRVLIVEDMQVNQAIMTTLLRDAGAQAETADNGAMGIQRVMQDMDNGLVFDVVLMDMRMPVMDGYEATAYLRKYGYRRPILAVTALASQEEREKTFEAGCDDYIAKPIDSHELIEKVKKYAAVSQT